MDELSLMVGHPQFFNQVDIKVQSFFKTVLTRGPVRSISNRFSVAAGQNRSSQRNPAASSTVKLRASFLQSRIRENADNSMRKLYILEQFNTKTGTRMA